jgi:hypothetical protein
MKEMIIVMMIMISLASFVNAQNINTTKFCIDNSTLFTTTALVIQEFPKPAKTLIINETIACPFGCDLDRNVCKEHPSLLIFISIAIIIGLVILYFIWRML